MANPLLDALLADRDGIPSRTPSPASAPTPAAGARMIDFATPLPEMSTEPETEEDTLAFPNEIETGFTPIDEEAAPAPAAQPASISNPLLESLLADQAAQQQALTQQAVTEATTPDDRLPIVTPELADALGVLDYRDPREGQRRQQAAAIGEILNLPMFERVNLGAAPVNPDGTVTIRRAQAVSPEAQAAADAQMEIIRRDAAAEMNPPNRAVEAYNRAERGARLGVEDVRSGFYSIVEDFFRPQQNPYLEKSQAAAIEDVPKLEARLANLQQRQAEFTKSDLGPNRDRISPFDAEISSLRNQLAKARQATTGQPVTENFLGNLSRASGDLAAEAKENQQTIAAEYTPEQIRPERDKEFWMTVADSLGRSAPTTASAILNPYLGLTLGYTQVFSAAESEFDQAAAQTGKPIDPEARAEYAHSQALLQTPFELVGDLALAKVARASIAASGKALMRSVKAGDPGAVTSFVSNLPRRAGQLAAAAAGETLITTPAQTVIEQKLAEAEGIRAPISNAELAARTARAMQVAGAQSLILGGSPVALETGVTTIADSLAARRQAPTQIPATLASRAPAEVPQNFTPISDPAAPAQPAPAPQRLGQVRAPEIPIDQAALDETFGPVPAAVNPQVNPAPSAPVSVQSSLDFQIENPTNPTMPEVQRAAETAGQPSQGGSITGVDSSVQSNETLPVYESANSPSDTRSGDTEDTSRAFYNAASEINDSGGSETTDRDTSRVRQTESLVGWARSKNSLISPEQVDSLPIISNSTSEHEVRFRESDLRVVKRTWPGVYGQIPVPKNGKLERANATPSEYLQRQALQVVVFGSDLRLEGVSFSDKPSMVLFEPPGQPSFVVSQEFFPKNESPTLDEISDRLTNDGFLPVPGSYFGWFRPSDSVVIVDAKPDNFVKTEKGVVPLDLQMAVFTPEQVAEAGLNSFKSPASSTGAAQTPSSAAKPATPRNRKGEAGSVLLPSREDLIQAGRNLYEAGMEFADWAGRMVQQFGEAVRDILTEIWKAVSGQNYLPQARERGSVAVPGKATGSSKPRSFPQTVAAAPGVAPEVKAQLTALDYDPISNAQTVASARARIDAAGSMDSAVTQFMGNAANPDFQPTAVDYATGIELLGQLQSRGRHEDAAAIADFMSRAGTTQGQAIQALSLISRLTPAGIEAFASRQITRAARNDPKIAELIQDNQRLRAEIAAAKRDSATAAIVDNRAAIKAALPAGADAVATNIAIREAILQSPTPLAAQAATARILQDNGLSEKTAIRLAEDITRDFLKTTTDSRAKVLQDLLALAETDRRFNKSKLSSLIRLNREGKLTDSRLHADMAKMLGIPAWTAEHSAKVQDLLRQREAATDPRVKLVKAAEALDVIYRESMPPGMLAKIDTFQTLMMLLNPKTWIRNIGGNAFMFGADLSADTVAWGADAATSIVTGNRTRTGLDIATRFAALGAGLGDIRAGYEFGRTQGLGRLGSFKEGVQTLIRLGRLYSSKKYDSAELTGFTGTTFQSGIGKVLEDTLGAALSLADRGFYESAFRASLENRMRTAAANGTPLAAPTPDMIAEARIDANRAIYQDDNIASRRLAGIRSSLNAEQRWGLGSMLIKFAQVPGSLLMRAIEFSPLGFIRNAYQLLAPALSSRVEFDQKAFTEQFSRSLVGTTGLVATGYWLAYLGVISAGRENEDEKKRNLARAEGWGAYKINLSALKRVLMTGNFWTRQPRQDGDVVVNYDWAQPLSISVAMGAYARENQKAVQEDILRGKKQSLLATGFNWMSAAAASATGAMNALVEQPLLAGLNKFFRDAAYDNIPGAALSALGEVPMSMIPTAARQWMQLTDNLTRETRDSSAFRQYVNELKSQLPGLSQTLPAKRDILGNEVERYQRDSNTVFNVLFNPSMVTYIKKSPLLTEMSRVYEMTGNPSVIPNQAARDFTIEGVKVRLTSEEISALQQDMGALSVAAVEKFVLDDPRYAQATWDTKAKAFTRALEKAATAAKYRILLSRPDLKQRAQIEHQQTLQRRQEMQQMLDSGVGEALMQ